LVIEAHHHAPFSADAWRMWFDMRHASNATNTTICLDPGERPRQFAKTPYFATHHNRSFFVPAENVVHKKQRFAGRFLHR
jgi:hypothetical protein